MQHRDIDPSQVLKILTAEAAFSHERESTDFYHFFRKILVGKKRKDPSVDVNME